MSQVEHVARAKLRNLDEGVVELRLWASGPVVFAFVRVLVVLPGGRIVYRYRSREAGDRPPVADVLAALPALETGVTT